MAGLKKMDQFLFALVCMAVVPLENACSPACQNGGTCRGSSSPYCDCPSGYKGSYCQKRGCSPSCKNGGTCSSSGVCHCAPGYTGSYCQSFSYFSSRGTDGYVFGGVITGCIVFISCIVIVTRLRVWLMARKRSRNVEAAQTNPTNPDPPFPNDEDPPEYLPPPEGDQQQTPL